MQSEDQKNKEIEKQKDLENKPKIDPLLLSIYIFGIAMVLIWGGTLLYRVY